MPGAGATLLLSLLPPVSSATSGILFTSVADDTGGNSDNRSVAPAPGNWDQVQLSVSGSTFQYCTFSYGGSGYGNTSAALLITAASNSVNNCTFSNNEYGIEYLSSQDGSNIGNSGANAYSGNVLGAAITTG